MDEYHRLIFMEKNVTIATETCNDASRREYVRFLLILMLTFRLIPDEEV
jgi:hypothetical protein